MLRSILSIVAAIQTMVKKWLMISLDPYFVQYWYSIEKLSYICIEVKTDPEEQAWSSYQPDDEHKEILLQF